MEFVIGIAAVAGLLWSLRQARVRADFSQEHGQQIAAENEMIAQTWRASHPKEKRLVVRREFRPQVPWPPTVRIRQKFKREVRPKRTIFTHTAE